MGTSRKRVLITGCGRSGTRYTSMLLQRLGLEVAHDRVGPDGIVSWLLAVEADAVPWGMPPRSDFDFDHVFHQVRDPLRVIPSTATFRPKSWEYVCRHIPCSLEDPVLLRGAKYWYHWNVRAEQIAEWRFRIEDITDSFEELCSRLGLQARRSVLDHVPKDVNTRRHGRLFHLYEELCARLRLPAMSFLRDRILGARRRASQAEALTWEVLVSMDRELAERIREKALEYGYRA